LPDLVVLGMASLRLTPEFDWFRDGMRGVRGGGEMVGERDMMGEREGLWMGLACGMGSS
jgi:hypothetical protein